ncbi:hypothetical protein HDU80_009800 [Chytriomyces hyalinus]|nr:hypothetical protein HDU80_009800 [Chytriomyces hyalinus]
MLLCFTLLESKPTYSHLRKQLSTLGFHVKEILNISKISAATTELVVNAPFAGFLSKEFKKIDSTKLPSYAMQALAEILQAHPNINLDHLLASYKQATQEATTKKTTQDVPMQEVMQEARVSTSSSASSSSAAPRKSILKQVSRPVSPTPEQYPVHSPGQSPGPENQSDPSSVFSEMYQDFP